MSDIDKQIAEKVMWWDFSLPGYRDKEDVLIQTENSFKPSTNIADAWLVVEKILELGYSFELDNTLNNWYCEIIYGHNEDMPIHKATASTAPMAICLAALKALEVNNET